MVNKSSPQNPFGYIDTTAELVSAALRGQSNKALTIVSTTILFEFELVDQSDVEFDRYMEGFRERGRAEVLSVTIVHRDNL